MREYIVPDDLRDFLDEMENSAMTAHTALANTVPEDSEDALQLATAMSECELRLDFVAEVRVWMDYHMVTGTLILPTIPDGFFPVEKSVDSLGKGE
jgi:hypothetical protein